MEGATKTKMRKRLPVFIVNDEVLFPNTEYRLELTHKLDQQIIQLADEREDHDFLIIHSLDDISTDDLTAFPSVGLLSSISLRIMVPNSKVRVVIQTNFRVEVEHYEKVEGIYYADVTEISYPPHRMEEEKVYTDLLIRSYEKNVREISSMSNAMLNEFSRISDLDLLTDAIASFLPLPKEAKKEYLYEKDPIQRAKKLLDQLQTELEITRLEHKIEAQVKQEIDEEQKKYYLRQKMKVISEEIGDAKAKNHEVEGFKEKLKKLKCNASVRTRIKEGIDRYESMASNSPEFSMTRDYIEWMLSLPWNYKTKDVTSLKEIEHSLNEHHYGMKEVKTRILEYIAVKQNAPKEKSPILCLIGPPGVGKTSLAYSIAEGLHRRLASISVGGINDEAEIVGHRRTYIGALPGRIIQGIKKAGSSNPVFVIDEIDKMTKDIKGDPASSLLEVLDKEQNSHFSDHYIEEGYDLSEVLFIATANYEEQIPLELRDRLEVIYIPSYTEYEKVEIAENYLIPKLLEQHGLSSMQVQFTKEALLDMVHYYTKEAGVRDLERLIAKVLRKIVRKSLEDGSEPFYSVNAHNLEDYLGKKIYLGLEARKEKELVGVVNGLAYTIFGGDILPIEVTHYKGKGNLILTGSLGEVMQESAQIALSYIKANQETFQISLACFEDDIHIHVPEGAVNKEGPSAGIALTTALISGLTGQAVKTNIAMTGEITLQGRILAIGGLREKALGAYRAGVRTIFLPEENKKDLEDIPKEIKTKMKFIFVEDYMEVAKKLFSLEEATC